MRLKNFLPVILAILFCPGCLFFFGEDFSAHDQVNNCTASKWDMFVKFQSGKSEEHSLKAEESVTYTRPGRNMPYPTITDILVVNETNKLLSYHLNPPQLSLLRIARGDGEMVIVIYDDGLACLPDESDPWQKRHPLISQIFPSFPPEPRTNAPIPTVAQYVATLKPQHDVAIKWTQYVIKQIRASP